MVFGQEGEARELAPQRRIRRPEKREHRFKAKSTHRHRPKEKGRGSARVLSADSLRRRHRHIANAHYGWGLERIGPVLLRGHGHETGGAIQNEHDLLRSGGRHCRPMLARRLPRLAQCAADRAWLVRIKRLLCCGNNGLCRCVAGKHARPRENLGNVQHRSAGAEPGTEQRKSWEAAQHPQEVQTCRLSLQDFLDKF